MILVAGESLFDLFVSADRGADRGDGFTFDARPGGSSFNVAVGLARLGQPTAFLGGLSEDFLGRRLEHLLAEEGISLRFVQRPRRPTTLSVVGLGPGGIPAYAFYGDGADQVLTLEEIPDLPAEIRAIHLSSFSTVIEPVGGTLEALVGRESAQRLIAYDPNIRPTIVPDMEIWRRKFARLMPFTHLLKISLEDFGLLFPGAEPGALARGWIAQGPIAQGPKLVVVTRGAEGATAWTQAGEVEVPASPTTLIDTVGAGDTYQAALLAALAETDRLDPRALAGLTAPSLVELLSFAGKAAALTCSRRGADMPRRGELPLLSTSLHGRAVS
jgi:fructokinase